MRVGGREVELERLGGDVFEESMEVLWIKLFGFDMEWE